MTSGHEWRDAFLCGLLTGSGGMIALVILGVIVRACWLAAGAAHECEDHDQISAKPESPRRLTSQDIVDRAAGNPARQMAQGIAQGDPRNQMSQGAGNTADPPCICGTVFEIN